MPYHDYKIESMGSATITPKGSFEAGSWQAFKLIYKVGKFGLDDWGGISIGLRPHFDGSKLQKTEPNFKYSTTASLLNLIDSLFSSIVKKELEIAESLI